MLIKTLMHFEEGFQYKMMNLVFKFSKLISKNTTRKIGFYETNR